MKPSHFTTLTPQTHDVQNIQTSSNIQLPKKAPKDKKSTHTSGSPQERIRTPPPHIAPVFLRFLLPFPTEAPTGTRTPRTWPTATSSLRRPGRSERGYRRRDGAEGGGQEDRRMDTPDSSTWLVEAETSEFSPRSQ